MLLTVLIALVVAASVYWGLNQLSEIAIDRFYLSDAATQRRQEKLLTDFRNYIKENEVSSTNTAKLSSWCRTEHNVYLTVYKTDGTIYETDGATDGDIVEVDDNENVVAEAADGETVDNTGVSYYRVKFHDGYFNVSLIDFSENYIYDIVKIVLYVVFVLTLLIVILVYTSSITTKIDKLSGQVSAIGRGKIDDPIVIKGRDEISELAADIDRMRNSLITQLNSEQRAWSANNELITSISHDIRNPLTSLIGYTDLLANEQYSSAEEGRKYVKICRDKAYQLKDLTDALFSYFLVFGNPTMEFKTENVNARILFEQFFGEYIVGMKMNGYKIHVLPLEEDVYINTDISLIKRFFDNIFSNIQKYAAKSEDITIFENVDKKHLYIQFSNALAPIVSTVESTKIGLKTCKKISELLNFSFDCREENGQFITEISFPIEDKPNEAPNGGSE